MLAVFSRHDDMKNTSRVGGQFAPPSASHLDRVFDAIFLFALHEFIALNDSSAGIPAEQRIVMARQYLLRFFEPAHRFLEKVEQRPRN